MLRSKSQHFPYHHSVGDGTMVQSFVACTSKKAIREIHDEKGKVISKEEYEIPYKKSIPLEEDLHPMSETCDLYTLANLQAAGVKLSPVSSNWQSLSLDQVGYISDNADSLEIPSLESQNTNSSEQQTINFTE